MDVPQAAAQEDMKSRGLGDDSDGFDHLSEAHAHMSSFVANMSSLAKICDPEMYDMVLEVLQQWHGQRSMHHI